MVWIPKEIDLSEYDLNLNRDFFYRVWGFRENYHHIKMAIFRSTASGANSDFHNTSLEDFFRYSDNENIDLLFGKPSGGITLTSYFDKGTIRYYILDIVDMEHERGVLDCFVSTYMENPKDYAPLNN